MASLTGMTLAQMRAATVNQLRTAVNNKVNTLTKAQIIRLDLYVREWEPAQAAHIEDKDTTTYWPDGQIKRRETVTRDESGAKTGTKRIDHTYYATGCIEDIVVHDYDAADVEIRRQRIHHFEDGRQPISMIEVGGG